VPRDDWDQLFGKQHQQNEADGRQVEIVDLEEEIQLEGWPIPHKLPPAKDYEVVGSENACACLEGGDGSLPGNESKILGFITHCRLVRLFKDGP